jgi:hypothetical protein
MAKFKFTWLDDHTSEHEHAAGLNDLISEMSIGAGYHIMDCLKSAELIVEEVVEKVEEVLGIGGITNEEAVAREAAEKAAAEEAAKAAALTQKGVQDGKPDEGTQQPQGTG